MIQRSASASEGAGAPGPASKGWRLGSALRKIQSISSKNDEKWAVRLHFDYVVKDLCD